MAFRRRPERFAQYRNDYQNAFLDKKKGVSTDLAGVAVTVLLILFFLGLFFYFVGIVKVHIEPFWLPFLVVSVVSFLFTHFALFRRDRYLPKFKYIDEFSRSKKWMVMAWGILAIVLAIFSFVYGMNTYVKWT